MSITLANLSWSTLDGRPLFSNIDLSFGVERTGLIGRNGVGKSTLLRLISGGLRPQSGTISTTGTLGFLGQEVQAGPNATIADLFQATEGLNLLRRAAAGLATDDELGSVDWMLESRIANAVGRFGLNAVPETSLSVLSGGQRTRAALAALMFLQPDFLILDEPTNHLDYEGRRAVIDLVANWRAGAIIVSHDRALLELMDGIVELTSLGATRFGGNWSQYRKRKARELAAAQHDLSDAQKRVANIAQSMQIAVERKARKDGKGRKKAAKGDLPRIVLGGLKDRSEITSATKARLTERLRAQALEDLASARARIEILQPLSPDIPSTNLSESKVVLRIDNVTFGYQPDRPILRNLSFGIIGPERVAITGPNGSGKTTLLALVAGRLQPWTGTVQAMTKLSALDQSVHLLDDSISIRDNFRRLNPETDENICRAALARFMFRADAALRIVRTLSGGERLRVGLACVLGRPMPPALLVLDEPSNHLDIESVTALEAGLRAYDGALLVVSHDETFLEAIRISRRVGLSRP